MARTMANELYNWSMLKWNTTWNMLKNICVIEPDFLKTLSMSICIVMLKAFWVWLGEVARYAKKHGVCSWCTVIHSAAASALWLGTGGHCHHRVFLSKSSSIITSTMFFIYRNMQCLQQPLQLLAARSPYRKSIPFPGTTPSMHPRKQPPPT